jgi:hypothetical protein
LNDLQYRDDQPVGFFVDLIYRPQVARYLEEYRRYLEELSVFNTYDPRTRPLHVILSNTGTAPAENIDLYLYLPVGLKPKDQPMKRPLEPEPPQRNQGAEPWLSSYASIMMPPLQSDYLAVNNIPPRWTGPTIYKGDTYEIRYSLDSLKHHKDWLGWDPVFVVFDIPDKLPKRFPVEYRITAANIPDPINGTLVILLEEQS